ncbi:unnamed protein product [Phaedon cochleariae]|uniref:Lipase domain-containing protein n=1 Tax=Phaedon cochleariae TaxID=80249 RepID=A0A9P0DAD5_PHACE|nr:unnamed protein product [Phaedon cochleariae]
MNASLFAGNDLDIDEEASNHSIPPLGRASDLTYHFYSQRHPSHSIKIRSSTLDRLHNTDFQPRKASLFIIHGWKNHNESDVNYKIRETILSHEDINVFVVDWSPMAGRNYISARNAVVRVGQYVADFIKDLKREFGLKLNEVKFVGHSLGAHICGNAVRNRITPPRNNNSVGDKQVITCDYEIDFADYSPPAIIRYRTLPPLASASVYPLGVEGNKKADILTKQGTESVFKGPEPYFGVTASAAKTTISGWAEGKTLTYWSELPGLTHSKAFLPKPSEKITRQILEWSRSNLRILTGLLTGHCRLRYHLGRMGLNQQTDCRFCCVEDKTAEHILCSCSSLERLRFDTFGFTNLEPIDFRRISPNSTMNFVKRCGLYGAALGGRVDRIVGLDPAGPLFTVKNKDNRLDASDAHFVQVIHTNGGLLGFGVAMGDADYFPNGGRSQNGCGMDLTGSCAHSRAYAYYAESLRSGGFVGRKCGSYSDYTKGRCDGNEASVMGGFVSDKR